MILITPQYYHLPQDYTAHVFYLKIYLCLIYNYCCFLVQMTDRMPQLSEALYPGYALYLSRYVCLLSMVTGLLQASILVPSAFYGFPG